MARQQEDRHAVRSMHLDPVDRYVWMPVRGLRAITRPAVMYGPLSCSLCVGMGSSLCRSIPSVWMTCWHSAVLAGTSCHASGCSAASRKRCSSWSSLTPIASAIHARLDMKPLTTGIAWPPGCTNTAAREPSSFFAIAASSCSSATGFSMVATRPLADRCSSQLRSERAGRSPSLGETVVSRKAVPRELIWVSICRVNVRPLFCVPSAQWIWMERSENDV